MILSEGADLLVRLGAGVSAVVVLIALLAVVAWGRRSLPWQVFGVAGLVVLAGFAVALAGTANAVGAHSDEGAYCLITLFFYGMYNL